MSKKPSNGSYFEAGDNEATEQELQDVAFTAISISVFCFFKMWILIKRNLFPDIIILRYLQRNKIS